MAPDGTNFDPLHYTNVCAEIVERCDANWKLLMQFENYLQ